MVSGSNPRACSLFYKTFKKEHIHDFTKRKRLSVSEPIPGTFVKNTGSVDPFRTNFDPTIHVAPPKILESTSSEKSSVSQKTEVQKPENSEILGENAEQEKRRYFFILVT